MVCHRREENEYDEHYVNDANNCSSDIKAMASP
jgi:hypothetical protein